MEVGYPNEFEPLLLPFSESALGDEVPTLYENVPTGTIKAVVAKHLGLAASSCQLPDLVEVDEDGYQWAAAAEIPEESSGASSSELSDLEEVGEDGYLAELPDLIEMDEDRKESSEDYSEESSASGFGSPTSAVHLGAIPPPPPLFESTISPITEHTREITPAPVTETPVDAAKMNDLGEAVLYVDSRDVFELTEEDIELMTKATKKTNA